MERKKHVEKELAEVNKKINNLLNVVEEGGANENHQNQVER
jgi:hypothetical protein